MSLDVFGLGQCCVDRLAFVERYPEPDEKQECEGLTLECGGPVATALVALSRWGRACGITAVVGDDEAGRIILKDLESEGVGASRVLVRPGTGSQQAFVAVERETGRRMIFWQRPSGPPPGVDEVELPPARVFLTDGLYAETAVAWAQRAPLTVVDAGTLREGTRALLTHADVFIASQSFARAFVGADDPVGACRKIREAGPAVAGVTLGERGYVASFGDRQLERPAHPVDAVDTTGCGDLFHGAYVEGMLRDWTPERCFDFAAWAAAQGARRLGGRAGIPDPAGYESSSDLRLR